MNKEQLAAFPEVIRDWDEVKNSDNPEAFWDQMTNLRKKIGTGLYQPGSDAGEEAWGKFSQKAVELSDGKLMPRPDLTNAEQREALYTSLGRPTEKAGYEFADVEGAPDPSEAQREFISEIAFKAGLTKDQLKAIDQQIRQREHASVEEAHTAFTEQVKTLKSEWGLSFDERVHAAKKIVQTFFPHLGENAALSAHELKAFYSLSKQLGKGSNEFGAQGDQPSTQLSPSEAAEKIAEIRNNREHPYHSSRAHGHTAAKKKMRELYLIKNNLPPA